MEFKAPKHNTPIATLIKNYKNKKSGKVVESRREIQWRFASLDWKHQKEILLAFIQRCDSDRDWASRKMFVCWDKSFIPIVKNLWEQHHEAPLSWLILRYFPKEYLKQNMDSLSWGRNYYYLCQRLIDDENFKMDKERLYESDIIKLYTISQKEVSDEEIREVFFLLIKKICKAEYRSPYCHQWDMNFEDIDNISILNNLVVMESFQDISYKLQRIKLADELHKWIKGVMYKARESIEYSFIKRMSLQRGNYKDVMIKLITEYSLKFIDQKEIPLEVSALEKSVHEILPDKISNPILNLVEQRTYLSELQNNNPSVKMLASSFDLEIDDSPLPF